MNKRIVLIIASIVDAVLSGMILLIYFGLPTKPSQAQPKHTARAPHRARLTRSARAKI